MIRYRLRWFALSTARLLLRRWQAVALIVGLSASASTTVLGNMEMLAYPLLALLSPDHGAVARGLHMVALLAGCSLWAGMQRVQIEGGPFMAFVCALPLSPRQLRRVSIAVLLLADSPLLFLAGWALVSTIVHRAPFTHPVLLGVVVVLALAAQIAVLERRYRDMLGLAVVGFSVACCLSMPVGVAMVIELLVAVGAAVAVWFGPRRRAYTVAAPVPIARDATIVHLGAVTAGTAAMTTLSGTVLLGALSLPHLFTDRHAVVVGTIVTGLWVAAMFAGLI